MRGWIDIPLGEQDIPDRLVIPEKLYGRGVGNQPCWLTSTAF
ncbi:MAG TPA: hypothetical protein VK752_12945 [Bryobacteraceae bacterium]|nr:hypothetical protein [Bryobacteraceae bacterium]